LKSDLLAKFQAKQFLSRVKLMSKVRALQFNNLVVGTRFKMSELGAAQCRSLAGKTGIVVEVSRRTTGVAALFDGAKRPTYLHGDFITPISGSGSSSDSPRASTGNTSPGAGTNPDLSVWIPFCEGVK
jgi:hypothetical protein